MSNILVLSCGTRNKIIQYFKRALTAEDGTRTGRVIATDMSSFAQAIYEADAYYIVPRITDDRYMNVILDICKNEKISGVLSLIDPELSLLAQHRDDFYAVGTTVIGSTFALCEMSLDKMEMYRWLTGHGFRAAKSYTEKYVFYNALEQGEIGFPVFVKPVRGSASISISKVEDRQTLEAFFDHGDHLMIQEYLCGQEIGADVYIDLLSGEIVSIFTKKKLVMRAGETDKAVSFRDEKLFELIRDFVSKAGYRGQIDIDIFEVDGEYVISEVNPRFGGGYPHAYECGCDHMQLIVNNLNGLVNEPRIAGYESGVYMMKYSEIMLSKE